jgi:hypothetical protein
MLTANRRDRVKHFINTELMAPNAMTVPVDPAIVREFADLAASDDPGPGFRTVTPWKDISDMRWISADTLDAFDRYEDAFWRMGIAEHVRQYLDLDREVRFYTGFLHTRHRCREANPHVDWKKTNNEGFTLITPVSGPDPQRRLLYQTMTGETASYEYRDGEAIIFGDHFTHTSPPGEADAPVTLLVFNFGSDKMAHWEKLARTQQRQCPLVQRPDGRFIRVDPYVGLIDQTEAVDRRDLENNGAVQ